jgi:transposase-like protein
VWRFSHGKIKMRKPVVPVVGRTYWTDKQKQEAVALFYQINVVSKVAETLQIPVDTVRAWVKQDWWKEQLDEFKREEKLRLSGKLGELADASLQIAADRLENGDWILDPKTGEVRRKPVNLRDAGRIAIDVINTKQKIETQEHHTVANEQIEEKLTKLAEAFMKLSKGITNNQKVEDLPYKEVSDEDMQEVSE